MTPEVASAIVREFAAEHRACGVVVHETETGAALESDPLHTFFLVERLRRHEANIHKAERAFNATPTP